MGARYLRLTFDEFRLQCRAWKPSGLTKEQRKSYEAERCCAYMPRPKVHKPLTFSELVAAAPRVLGRLNEDLADRLGVTSAILGRWISGVSKPHWRVQMHSLHVLSHMKTARDELETWKRYYLDDPADLFYHAKDRSWWRRVDRKAGAPEDGWLVRGQPPPVLTELEAETDKLRKEVSRLKKKLALKSV